MANQRTAPLERERNLIIAILLVLSAAAWGVVIYQARSMGAEAMGLAMGLTAPAFLLTWVVMMVAMMFPAAAPMILMFSRISATKRASGSTVVPTWVFAASYLMVWALVGVPAYAAAVGLDRLTMDSMWLMANEGRLTGGLLVLAGIYQFTPLKHACLARCRTPFHFILNSWRDGYAGALRLGLTHGGFCLGCCWLFFALLVLIGMMNLGAMVLITGLVAAEKILPWGERISRWAAVLLIAYGLLVIVAPATLPGMM